MPDNDKDKIKEILEGHNKKFTATEIIVGIVVILLVGAGIGYAIFKLLTPSSVPQVEYSMQSNQVVQTPEVKQTQPPQAQGANGLSVGNNSISSEQNNAQQIYNGNATISQTQKQTQVQTESQSNQLGETSGPQIVTPQHQKTKVSNVSSGSRNKHKIVHVKEKGKKIYNHAKKANKVVRHTYIYKKKYLVWVSSNENRKFALLTVLKLRKCGHNAFSKEVKVKGKIYTRVYVGPVSGYEAAEIEAKEIKRQLHLKYMPIIKRYDKIP